MPSVSSRCSSRRLRIAVARRNSCGVGLGYLVSSSLILSAEFINSSIFLNRIELVFLQHYWGIEAVGFYAVGLSLANLALQLPVQLSGSLLPYYSEQMHSQASGKLPVQCLRGRGAQHFLYHPADELRPCGHCP